MHHHITLLRRQYNVFYVISICILNSFAKHTICFTSSLSSLCTFGDSALILWVFLDLAVGVGEGVTGSRVFFSFSCSEISPLWANNANLSQWRNRIDKKVNLLLIKSVLQVPRYNDK